MFEDTWQRKQELRMRPVADRIYKSIFGDDIQIDRFEKEDEWTLDKYFAMDVKITIPNGLILTGQEKFLSYKYRNQATATVEYLQDPTTGEHGDWFKLGVQFYFVGYCSEDDKDFYPWVMLNWPAVVIATTGGKLNWYSNSNQDGRARASFRYCYMNQVPAECVIAKNVTTMQIPPLWEFD